jgi:DNA polymerase-3 subunit epsilon
MLFRSPPWETLTYWSLDLETGGLRAKSDAIVAVGMVPIVDGSIHLGRAYESMVRPAREAHVSPESVAVHGLLPGTLADAPPLADVLTEIGARIDGGVLVVHNASVDEAFLRRAYRDHARRWPRPVVVDTVDLLVTLHGRRSFLDPGQRADPEVNLSAARRALGLPDYPAHDALTDAVATAELFLVLRHHLDARRLRDLV